MSYSNNQQGGYQPKQNTQQGSYQPRQNIPPGFSNHSNQSTQAQGSSSQAPASDTSVDTMFKKFLDFQAKNEKTMGYEFKNIHSKIDGSYNELNNKIRNLENQFASMNSQPSPQQGSLPGKPEQNPKETMKAITLRSGRELPPRVLTKDGEKQGGEVAINIDDEVVIVDEKVDEEILEKIVEAKGQKELCFINNNGTWYMKEPKFINNNGTWYMKEPNFQYNNYQQSNHGNQSTQAQGSSSQAPASDTSVDAMFKKLLNFQAKNEKTIGYEFKNIHSKIDGSYNELNNKIRNLENQFAAMNSQPSRQQGWILTRGLVLPLVSTDFYKNFGMVGFFVKRFIHYKEWAWTTSDSEPQIGIGGLITPLLKFKDIPLEDDPTGAISFDIGEEHLLGPHGPLGPMRSPKKKKTADRCGVFQEDTSGLNSELLYGLPRYQFEQRPVALPNGPLRQAHEHIGNLQRWNKAHDRLIFKLKDKCNELNKTVKRQAEASAQFMKKVADILTRGAVAGYSSSDFDFLTHQPQPPIGNGVSHRVIGGV
ncbi:hypothetical protein F2Q69_00014331 [Brassica cretica]|uniref:Uncharacterized protein n=1 Tax=Brassica cretica TaxID=69181 RepID=A0A8S9QVC8_BRACR|nr:hypothetical protein F2Q69_00014331 [Brassica cretica]